MSLGLSSTTVLGKMSSAKAERSITVPEIEIEISDLLAVGQKIAAIKRLQEVSGLGFKAARAAVESIAADRAAELARSEHRCVSCAGTGVRQG